MKVLVNAVPLTGLSTGISRYVRQLYAAFEELTDAPVGYFDGSVVGHHMPESADPEKWRRKIAAVWKLPDSVVCVLRTAHTLKYEMSLRSVCRSHHFDIYHETGWFPPVISSVPIVYTIHDLSLITHAKMHPRDRVWFYELFRKRRMRYAAHILTVSEFIRNEICEVLSIPPEDVTAIPEAAAPHFWRRSFDAVERVRGIHSLPQEYLLFVGSLEPRKNLPLLIHAMRRCRTDISLVLAGWEGWGEKSWMETIQGTGLEKRIVFTGYVDDETLACLYSGATAFVYPSLYEGFGLPILEAMSCGCPVICSNTASMPEVAGNAAVLIDPCDAEELAVAIDTLTGDRDMRYAQIQKGLCRAAEFSWRRTAELTRDVFYLVSKGSGISR
jgi:glycosyltransferase involved in cell wall biosynthesis